MPLYKVEASFIFEFANVSKTYKGDPATRALERISFSLPDRGFVLIKGPSGSGKSTILNMMAGLERPDEGKILFKGRDLSSLSKKEISAYRRGCIGILFQHFNLIDRRGVLDNVALASSAKKKEAEAKAVSLLKRFGLEGKEKAKAGLLSGGEKQRVALARALINDPEAIIADEPTGALDEENEKLVFGALSELSEEKLVIVVSHSEKAREYADFAMEIDEGRIVSGLSLPHDSKPPSLSRPSVNSRGRLRFGKAELRMGVSFLFSSLVLSAAASFFAGSSGKAESMRYQDAYSHSFRASEESKVEIAGSPVSLVRKLRPSKEDIAKAIGEGYRYKIMNDYSSIVGEYHPFTIRGDRKAGASFLYLGEYASLGAFLKEGSLDEGQATCLVNEEFAREYGDVLYSELSFSSSTYIQKGDLGEKVELSFRYLVTGIIHEEAFMNAPKVYCRHAELEARMKESYVVSFLKEYGPYTLFDAVEEGINDGHDYVVECLDRRSAERLRSIDEEGAISFLSSSYEAEKAYKSLMDSISACLLPFILISSLASFLTVFLESNALFFERKKEVGTLMALGYGERDIAIGHLFPPVILSLGSAAFALLVVAALSFLLKGIVPLANPIVTTIVSALSLCGSLFMPLAGCSIPLAKMRGRGVLEALKEE